MADINEARLTDAEMGVAFEFAVATGADSELAIAHAQLRKALWWVIDRCEKLQVVAGMGPDYGISMAEYFQDMARAAGIAAWPEGGL